ncbi:MAG TPA: class II aldolase/adducin family protein [Candidatus Angelobacter sp.]|nr:class II aldolase/adducin family protein [Candidatus Angelobacter sp.]
MSAAASLDAVKFDICCAARILYRAGLSVGVAGHISVAIGDNKMLMNRFGPSFATLRPADIVTFDFQGKVLEHDPSVDPYVNDTVALHAVIHRYNPKIVAVAHTHPPAAITWSTFRRTPEVYDQESCMLADDVAIVEEDYTGLAASEDRIRPFAEALGSKATALLPNHGAITTGPLVQVAVFRMLLLEGMCARNISVAMAAQATGFKPHAIKMEDALTAKAELARIPGLQPMWADQLQRLQQTDPGLFENRPRSIVAA